MCLWGKHCKDLCMEDYGVAKWFIHIEGCLGFPTSHTCSYHCGKSGPEIASMSRGPAHAKASSSRLSYCPASLACVPCCDLLLCWGTGLHLELVYGHHSATGCVFARTTQLRRGYSCIHGVSMGHEHTSGGGVERGLFSPGIILAWVCDGPGAFSKWAINFPSFWGLLICAPPT